MNINFSYDEILFLEGETGTVGVVKVAHDNKMLFIATQDNEEIVQFLQAYLTREEDSPIVILNKNHPSTKRLSQVLSVGEKVNLNCNIIPGTHPEQDVLCSCDSLSGLSIVKTSKGVELNTKPENYTIERF